MSKKNFINLNQQKLTYSASADTETHADQCLSNSYGDI